MLKIKALEKAKQGKLTFVELRQWINNMKLEIQRYEICIENYPPDRMQKYGLPYLKRLESEKRVFERQLNKRVR